MRIAIVVGTRPEAIKLAPIAELLGPESFIIHTQQHYNTGMTGQLTPDLVLNRSHSTTRGDQLGSWTSAFDLAFRRHSPDVVIVQGDTTSALAGGLAANTTGTPLVHVEAGLRSFDRSMPEEHNRVLIDHLADLCCAPTSLARQNLLAERIPPERIETTGNTIVEAVATGLTDRRKQADLLDQLGFTTEPYILATFHRPENTDSPTTLSTILRELTSLPVPVILPLHPRTQHRVMAASLHELAGELRVTGPLDYPTLLTLIRHAAIVISDSGGIQEETTVLKRPLLVVRRSNERPEIETTFGTRLLPGPEIRDVVTTWLSDLDAIQGQLADIPSPYGDGAASAQIVRAIQARFAGKQRTQRHLPKTA